jgi:hypothetical protein
MKMQTVIHTIAVAVDGNSSEQLLYLEEIRSVREGDRNAGHGAV